MLSAVFLFVLAIFSNCNKKNGTTPPAPTLVKISVDDITRAEGNSGTVPFTFTISLDQASSQNVTVITTAVEGLARINTDFVQSTQTTTFLPNELQKTVTINVVGDDVKEGDDDFKIILSGATNAVIYKGTGTGVIQNDDTRVDFTNAGYDAPASYPGYTLAWADEFNGASLSSTDWSFENGDGCPGICGWGNNELEYYTSRPENLFFQDGKMIIEARKENYSGKSYTSSKILTRGKKVFKYARIDIRAKLPKGKGIWPAFWLLPQNNVFGGWPKSGEIDLMEMVGHEANKTHGTLHFGPGPGSTQLTRSHTLASGIFNDEFHVFSLEWKENSIKWFLDGVLFSTYTSADFGSANYPFNEDFFMIINLAVGGNWPGNPDATTYFPQWLIVDYIRVYQ